ncbi:MAG: ABC transporter permease [Enterobacteriaceae bacterium]
MAVERLKAAWRCFTHSFTRESRLALSSPLFHWVGWIAPVLIAVLIGGTFSEGSLEELPIAVIDHDHSTLSRQLIDKLDAGSHARVIDNSDDLASAMTDLRSSKVYAVLYIPYHLEADMLAGRQPQVVFYYNALLYSAGFYATLDFAGLIQELNQTWRAILAPAMQRPIPPLGQVNLYYGSLFNSNGNAMYYQLFALIIHLLQLCIVTWTIYILDKRKTILHERPFSLALMGKLAPYTLSYTALLMLELAVLFIYSQAEVKGNPLLMLVIGFCYVVAAQSLGVLLFTFTKSIITAFSLIGALVSVALSFSGLLVPELSMPLPAQIIANIEPLTHALYAMFDAFLRGNAVVSSLQACTILLLYPILTLWLVRRRLIVRLASGGEEQ